MESVGFEVNAATWFCLSFLLIVAVFFRFGRFWSLRNVDLALLLATSPGFVLLKQGCRFGDVWLFASAALLLARACCDALLPRRPRLEPNLNPSGMAFLGASACAFLMTIVVTSPPPESTVITMRRAGNLLHRQEDVDLRGAEGGPATPLLAAPVVPLSTVVAKAQEETAPDPGTVEVVAAQIMVLLAHLAVIGALIAAGRVHFADPPAGVAMATLYLLLPCTAYDMGKVHHVLPAALVAWAFVAWRRPMVAGSLLGLACGTVFYPVFLLPLWASFYGRRGAVKFGLALGIVAAVLLGSLALTSADRHSFTRQTIGSIEWNLLQFRDAEPGGLWSHSDPAYRIPVAVAFGVMVILLTIFPRKKTLEHLLSHSTAIVIGTQFWYPQKGGIYVLWYLPLLLFLVFRPRLAHLVAVDSSLVRPEAGLATTAASPSLVQSPAAQSLATRSLAGGDSQRLFR